MGLLQKFFNSDSNFQRDKYAESPEGQIRSNNSQAEKNNFQNSDLDLENESPNGGTINTPYVTKIGSEIKSFTTTHPYTPKKPYFDPGSPGKVGGSNDGGGIPGGTRIKTL